MATAHSRCVNCDKYAKSEGEGASELVVAERRNSLKSSKLSLGSQLFYIVLRSILAPGINIRLPAT